ncbi:MAG: putative membrane protein YedE/YeeE [Cyclobacteriaceae bacterium]|jgi:uncharacterized membrane protein YedE/YeeE
MKKFLVLLVGILFGIVLTKSEVISWYRIYEMFRFESFHMYGVIGSAVILGIIGHQLIKRFKLRSLFGEPIKIESKPNFRFKPMVGGTIFGLGWALTGACPGPIYIIIGNGYSVFVVVLIAALIGAFVHGIIAHRLPNW